MARIGVSIGEITINPATLGRYARSATGPVARDLMVRGQRVQVRARQLVRKRTRHTEQSIVKRLVIEATGPVVYVQAAGQVAFYEHEGTRPHIIRPVRRQFLRFPGGAGGVVFAKIVHHPGTTGSKFLTRALPAARG